jgi:hypothetical protein
MEKEAEKLYSQYESSKNQPGNDDDAAAIGYAGPQDMTDALESLVSC